MSEAPPARLLDVTRLASRAGRGLTGIDRVERAYLAHLLWYKTPVHGLARTLPGYALLDRDGLRGLLRRIDGGQDWGQADRIARLGRRLAPMQQRADADLRRLAVARSSRWGLGRLLRRHLPAGTAYLNVGHSNLTDRVVRAVRSVDQSRISVLVHDTIPADFPDFQRPGTVERFRAFLARAGAHSDHLIYNSASTRADVARWLDTPPPGVVAHLGVEPARPDPALLPPGLPPQAPYFVTVGTIEPRKNHALLLDVWTRLAEDQAPVPWLLICGARGWRNEEVFARLDALPGEAHVRELPNLSDPALSALVAGAAGLLQPSFAEGFGLPPVEAAALGTPVACADLPVFREILGDIPVYLDPADGYSWAETVRTLAGTQGKRTGKGTTAGYVPPTWQDHFNTVLNVT